MHLFQTRLVWAESPHNAFPDLVRWGQRIYGVVREGSTHVSQMGQIRILSRGPNGISHRLAGADPGLQMAPEAAAQPADSAKSGIEDWCGVSLIALPDGDLRDPKLSIAPDGRMVLLATAAYAQGPVRHQSLAWTSWDGLHWDGPVMAAAPNHWLWRIAWYGGRAYGFAYGTGGQSDLFWYALESDLRPAESVRQAVFSGQYVNETGLCFAADGTAFALLRRDNRDPAQTAGVFGRAAPPYRDWDWRPWEFRIGGPCLIWNHDGSGFFAGYRRHVETTQWLPQWTEVAELDLAGQITRRVALPSGGDCSYPGLLLDDAQLLCLYYSSHAPANGTALYEATINGISAGLEFAGIMKPSGTGVQASE